jgi:N-acetylglucosamine kinase-like BadF-type ATPase
MKKYIVGVDGGNTKTDYFLFDTEANFIDFYRGGTCSHEGLKDSFAGSHRIMNEVLTAFLGRNGLTPGEISSSVFGLAGVDTPTEKFNLEQIVEQIGFSNYRVVNDSFLGIKAGTTHGYGVCSINGTGTSSGGIDRHGNTLQVGGIGSIVGDEAGGRYISRLAVRTCYDELFRFGEKSSLTKIVLDLLGVTDPNLLMEAITHTYSRNKVDYNLLTIAVFEEANKNDRVAIRLLKQIGENLARSAGGVISHLDFEDTVDVVLAGSVWVKGASPVMVDSFKEHIEAFTHKKCNIHVLQVPPATGAVIWALECALDQFPEKEIQTKIIQQVQEQLDRIEKGSI